MKRRLTAYALALTFALALLPGAALAEEPMKLETPTELKWGVSYGFSSTDGHGEVISDEKPGSISWVNGGATQGMYEVTLYHKTANGDVKVRSQYEDDGGGNAQTMTFHTSDLFLMDCFGGYGIERPDGDYYYTVQSLGDGTEFSDSDVATSDVWHYTNPAARLPAMQAGVWDGKTASFQPLADESMVDWYQVGFFFAPSEAEEPELAGYTIGLPWELEDYPLELDNWTIQENGNGLYYFAVRAIGKDITQIRSGPWSPLSEAYSVTNASDWIRQSLEEMAEWGLSDEELRSEMIWGMDREDLKTAMLADRGENGVLDAMRRLESGMQTGFRVQVTNDRIEMEEDDVSVVGALLNPVVAKTVTLKIGIPKSGDDISIPFRCSDVLALSFSMDLEGVEDRGTLPVPVAVTLPVPESINPDFLVILHYSKDGGQPEEILHPYVFWDNGYYATVVLDHFSDFVMTEECGPKVADPFWMEDGVEFLVSGDGETVRPFVASYDGEGRMLCLAEAEFRGGARFAPTDPDAVRARIFLLEEGSAQPLSEPVPLERQN